MRLMKIVQINTVVVPMLGTITYGLGNDGLMYVWNENYGWQRFCSKNSAIEEVYKERKEPQGPTIQEIEEARLGS